MTGSAIGRILIDGRDAGSGFAITGGRALTAGHVVRPVTEKPTSGDRLPAAELPEPTVVCVRDRGEPGLVRAVVEYRPEGSEPISVIRIEVDSGLDVAVLHLQRSAPAVLPVGQVTLGADWRVETRPKASDPTLTGTVTDPRRRLQNQHGEETTLIQLWVREDLGDYQGYSGSPVTSVPASGAPGGVLGVLVEQGRWRTGPLGQRAPVANVLFAAPIEQVLTEFGLSEVTVGRAVGQIPLPVPFEVRRPQQLNRVIDALLAGMTQPPSDGQLVGLVGMGGSGKSVLAAAAARDPKIRDAFPDGRFWLELGPHPPLLQLQAGLAAALGDSTPITDIQQGRARLSRLLAERSCLLVLDNVWDKSDLSAFIAVEPMCCLLVTTRDATILAGNAIVMVDELAPAVALQLLAGWTAIPVGQLPAEAAQIAEECGYLPLALALCGAMIATGGHSWAQLLGLLHQADVEALHSQLLDYPQRSLAVALGASIDSLRPDARSRYMELAVFDTDGPVPPAALQVLWEVDRQDVTALVGELASKSLLRVEADYVSLHDLQMGYLVRRAADTLPALHDRLLAAYSERCHGGWATGPDDGYFYQHLVRHLRKAGRFPELRTLLLDLDWINAKLAVGNISGLLADYDSLLSDPAVLLVAGALRLSAHVLTGNPGQLPGQLTGRLASEHDPQLRDLMLRIRLWPASPWLRPLTGSLISPGGPLLRTLTGHDSWVYAVAFSADGYRIVSGGGGTVRVWDLESGEPLHVLADHGSGPDQGVVIVGGVHLRPGRGAWIRQWVRDFGEHTEVTTYGSGVWAVAVSADGRRAISGGADGTVRVWDLESGELLNALTGHDSFVAAVAITADGRRAVSGGGDGTVRVWNLDSGELLLVLADSVSEVRAVAVSADGSRAVFGGDGTVQVWNLDPVEPLYSLADHDSQVNAVAVSGDGSRAVFGGSGGTVGRWDLNTGELLHDLAGHHDLVTAVAVSADGSRAASGSEDGTVRVWDLDLNAPLRVLTGHDGSVAAVALSADGSRAVSGGRDGTVRVWDLTTDAPPRTLTGHESGVSEIAVSADGHVAVSASRDGTVRTWDPATCARLRTLTGHDGSVTAVALSTDGRRAVSGGGDGTVRVWDIDSGASMCTLTGHDGFVGAVALSGDGSRGVSCGRDDTVRVWDLAIGTLLHTLTGRWTWLDAVAMSADGRRVISGHDGKVRVWDIDSGKLLRTLTGHSGRVTVVAASADGRRAISGGHDGTVRVWDLATGKQVPSARQRLADSARQRLADWRPGRGTPGRVCSLSVSADGSRAVSGASDGTVQVWDIASGALLHTLTGHHGEVGAVAVSADGRRAASGSDDGTVRAWDLAQAVEIASFVSDSMITAVAVTPPGARVIAGTSTGPVHFLELCGYE
jgi:WD40 repeat protein